MLVLVGVACAGAWIAYRQFGRLPGEILDYLDRRLEGHTKLEVLLQPLIHGMRGFFDAPSAAERARVPFIVASPPPRRGPEDIGRAEPRPPGGKVWHVSPNGPITRISEVARLARSGDYVEIEAGDYRQDVAIWTQAKLSIRGVNGAVRLFADGHSAEGKAIWVFRRGEFDIANIDFIGARAPDGNGAGIRFEGGFLRVRDCLFWGNQMGLLTVGDSVPNSSLVIESSEFAYSHVQNKWGHNLYVGSIESLTVTGSYFHHAGVGHLLKSRARVNNILYNRLTDESGGRASYEMDFPNGGVVRLLGNLVEQQRGTENATLIAFGLEGYKWPANVLQLGSNTLVNAHPHGGTFLRVAPGADRVDSANNLLVGSGEYQVKGVLRTFNDLRSDWEDFVRPARHDYRLLGPGVRLAYQAPLDSELRARLLPQAQYVHPRRVKSLANGPIYVGAIQDTEP